MKVKHYNYGRGPSTPWGRADTVKTHARGVAEVGTPGHGGFRVSRGLATKRMLPEVLKVAIETTGYFWFEEDCAYSLVVLSMTELFEEGLVELARSSAKNWYPDEYELITGEMLSCADSYVLQKRSFENATRDRFVVTSASGSWKDGVPDGMVEVHARRASDGAIRVELVDAKEYDGRGKFGYVLPEAS